MKVHFQVLVILLGCNILTNKAHLVKGLLRAEKILNGIPVTEPLYKYTVAVMYKVSHGPDVNPCAGSILNDKYIATVAHCFFYKRLGTYIQKEFYIAASIFNTWTELFTTVNITVDLVITPVYYQPTQLDTYNTRGDLAIVKLAKSLGVIEGFDAVFRSNVIPKFPYAYYYKLFHVTGYGWHTVYPPGLGEIMPTGETDGSLRYALALVLPTSECERIIGDYLDNGNLCARIAGLRYVAVGICQFDGGAPLVHDGYLAGIAIHPMDPECNEKRLPGVYINTSYYRDFIQEASSGIITDEMNVVQLSQIDRDQYTFQRFHLDR